MGKIWLTSDLHLNHDKDFIWGARGFSSITEMNNEIINKWNFSIDNEDDVYCLGDIMLGNELAGARLLHQLKGNIHIIRGNHDTDNRMTIYNHSYNVVEICEGKFLRYGNYHFYLTHYPCLTDNYTDGSNLERKMINLCGHRHAKDPFIDWDKGIIYHCELDAHKCYPVLIDNIIKDINNKMKEI